MILARLILDSYRQFSSLMPSRLRLWVKRYIDKPRDAWRQIGILQSPLQDTPYQLILDMHHWHQRWTYVKGHYPEPHIAAILNRYLKAGDVYIDVGANIGVHVIYAAAQVGIKGQVIAFEPNPHSYKRLVQQVELNHVKHVQAHHTALGRESGTVTLHGCNDENVGSSIRDSHQNTDNDCDVPLNRADDLLAHISNDQAGICKIDVEGFEMEVLQGMSDFLKSHPNFIFIIEATDEWLGVTGSSVQELLDLFSSLGFQAYQIDPDQSEPVLLNKAPNIRQFDALFKHHSMS